MALLFSSDRAWKKALFLYLPYVTKRIYEKESSEQKKGQKNFSKKEELAVWNKARPTDDLNMQLDDICGLEVHFDKYGNAKSNCD